MTNQQGTGYTAIFRNPSFRTFWLAFTFSALGDGITRVALTWFVYERTHSPAALGLLGVAYTAPVIIGGLFAGSLLDRFDRRKVMFWDNVLRAVAVATIPVLHLLGTLDVWHIYAVATIYGLLMMISLAGSPSLIPLLVPNHQFSTANALETLSWTLTSVIGPPVAGLLIARVGAPMVVSLDAVSYGVFALALLALRLNRPLEAAKEAASEQGFGLRHAFDLLIHNPVLLSTTIMFLTFNIGFGLLGVWLPIYVADSLNGGAELYGLLLGGLAVGEMISSLLVGSMRLRIPLGASIALAQMLAGMSMALMLAGATVLWPAISLALVGFFSAPLTIWAQTLRMQIIPDHLRGRTFALLRMTMQGSTPLGSAAAGMLLPFTGIGMLIAFSAALMGIPGLIGASITALRTADQTPSPLSDTTAI